MSASARHNPMAEVLLKVAKSLRYDAKYGGEVMSDSSSVLA